MASFIAMEPADGGTERGEETVFVRDGFSFWAFVIPLVWFLWHRMWIEAVAALILIFALAGLDDLQGISGFTTIFSLLVSFLIGLEACNLRVASMRRAGWTMNAVVEAANHDEAEARYIGDFLAVDADAAGTEAVVTRPVATNRPPAVRPRPGLGLFDHPAR